MSASLLEIIRNDDLDSLICFMRDKSDFNLIIDGNNTNCTILKSNPPVLSVSCFYSALKCFQYLQGNDWNTNLRDLKGRHLIHFTAACDSLIIFDQLEALGIDLRHLDYKGNGIIHYCSKYNGESVLRRCLLNGLDIAKPNQKGELPIHIACKKGYKSIVELLCNYESPIDLLDAKQRLPIQIALEGGHGSIVRILLAKKSPTDFLIANLPPIVWAARCGKRQIVEILLEFIKDRIDDPDALGWTPLHFAAEQGYTDICEILVQNGASINKETINGMTSLHLAQNRQRLDTSEFLQKNGALTWV